jgi:hypothetical protein
LAVKNGDFHLTEAICVKHEFTNVCEVKGILNQKEFVLLKRETYNLTNWNIILLSLAFDNLQAFKFFTKELTNHLRLGLRAPPI